MRERNLKDNCKQNQESHAHTRRSRGEEIPQENLHTYLRHGSVKQTVSWTGRVLRRRVLRSTVQVAESQRTGATPRRSQQVVGGPEKRSIKGRKVWCGQCLSVTNCVGPAADLPHTGLWGYLYAERRQ